MRGGRTQSIMKGKAARRGTRSRSRTKASRSRALTTSTRTVHQKVKPTRTLHQKIRRFGAFVTQGSQQNESADNTNSLISHSVLGAPIVLRGVQPITRTGDKDSVPMMKAL